VKYINTVESINLRNYIIYVEEAAYLADFISCIQQQKNITNKTTSCEISCVYYFTLSFSLFRSRSDGFITRSARAIEKRQKLTIKLNITTKIVTAVR